MIRNLLGMDDKDVEILHAYMKNPNISQNEIAKLLKLSQPSIFVRIQKLKKNGLLRQNIGIEFNKTKMFLCKVDVVTKKPKILLDELKKCPFFVNGFTVSGRHNVTILIAHENLKKIEEIVNTHLRNKEYNSDVSLNIIVSSAKEFVFQIVLNSKCEQDCSNCQNINLN